jgi:hypothetical protein
MKAIWFSLAVVVGVGLCGCNDHTTPGGPGATNSNDSILGPKDDSFVLSPVSVSLQQSESKAASLSIKRGKNFDEDVKVSFDKMPTGVTVDPASPVIKHGEKEAKITIKAADDAAIGDFTVKVTGHPQKGPDGSTELKIKVEKK